MESEKFRSMDEWLDTATRGLCDVAKDRIRTELSAHFEDARLEALSEGKGEANAVQTALAALGDPRKARKQFRARHFTKWEFRWHQSLVEVYNFHTRIPRYTIGITLLLWLLTLNDAIANLVSGSEGRFLLLSLYLVGCSLPLVLWSRELLSHRTNLSGNILTMHFLGGFVFNKIFMAGPLWLASPALEQVKF